MSDVIVPKKQSLKKYGITQEEWLELAEEQGNVCPICGKLPENKRLCTDHQHVAKYKKMPACNRKTYIRGLCCLRCNLMYLPVGITVEKAKNIVKYLEKYEAKRLEIESKSMPKSVLEGVS
jgi:hypothetical protein